MGSEKLVLDRVNEKNVENFEVVDPAEFLEEFYEKHYPEIERKWSPEKKVKQKVIDGVKSWLIKLFWEGIPVEKPVPYKERSYRKLWIETARKQLDLVIGDDINEYNIEKHVFFIKMVCREMHRIAYGNVYLDYQYLFNSYLEEDKLSEHEGESDAMKKAKIIQHCLDVCDDLVLGSLTYITINSQEKTITFNRKNGEDVTYTYEEYLEKVKNRKTAS